MNCQPGRGTYSGSYAQPFLANPSLLGKETIMIKDTVSFDNMSISDVEELVGQKADNIQVQGKWMVATFAGGHTRFGTLAADRTVKWLKW